MTANRQPAGIPTGGRFAPGTQGRSAASLPAGTGERPLQVDAAELRVGDVFVQRDVEGRPDGVEVQIVGARQPHTDPFGRQEIQYMACRLDTGREGYLRYGEGAAPVEVARRADPAADTAPAPAAPSLSPTMDRTGETAFKIKGGTATYTMRAVDARYAEDNGCPGATHLLMGRHGNRFGTLAPVTGKTVRVPGWSAARKGMLAEFRCDRDPDYPPLKGYLGE